VLTSRIEPDTTKNIELGAKFSALDNRLTINTAIFRTDWDNLPTNIVNTSSTCVAGSITNNIGSAESQGIEMDINYLFNDWQLSLGASYIDTKRVEVRTPLTEGEPLPYAPRTNAILGLQYNFTTNGFNSYIRTDIAYVGEYESAPARLGLEPGGDYGNVNLRFGMTIEQWDLAIYAKNLSNNDELLVQSGGADENGVGVRSRPRQVGLAINYSF
jgi:iron complex outermembrane receptor protein